MSSDGRFEFTKENIDTYLKALAKEYRRLAGKAMPAELILIGGAAVLLNYGFRNMTTDVDALIHAASAMDDAARRVADRYDLPNGWLNADFRNTDSYSEKLPQFSVYCRTYSNIVSIRTIEAQYLIAMKLRAGRQYKSDLSDVLGILAEHEKRGAPISMEMIRQAVSDLYGAWDSLPETSQVFIENVMRSGRFAELYEQVAEGEAQTRTLLVRFEQDYPGAANASNADAIAGSLRKKADRASILALLRERQAESGGAAQKEPENRDESENS